MKKNGNALSRGVEINISAPVIPFIPSFKLQGSMIPSFNVSQTKLPAAVKFEQHLDIMKAQREAMIMLAPKPMPKFTEGVIPSTASSFASASLPGLEKMEKQLTELRAKNTQLINPPTFSTPPVFPDLDIKLNKEISSLVNRIVVVPNEARLPRDWRPMPSILIEDITTKVDVTKKEQGEQNVNARPKVNVVEEESFSDGGIFELIERCTVSEKLSYGLTLYDFAKGSYGAKFHPSGVNAEIAAEILYGINFLSTRFGSKFYTARADISGPNGYLRGRMQVNVGKDGMDVMLDVGGGVFVSSAMLAVNTKQICFGDSCIQANINANIGVGFGSTVGVGFQSEKQKPGSSSVYFSGGIFLGVGNSLKVVVEITPNKSSLPRM